MFSFYPYFQITKLECANFDRRLDVNSEQIKTYENKNYSSLYALLNVKNGSFKNILKQPFNVSSPSEENILQSSETNISTALPVENEYQPIIHLENSSIKTNSSTPKNYQHFFRKVRGFFVLLNVFILPF